MERTPPRLVRRLGLIQTTAVALGAMIGAGVYVVMGEAAGTTGGSLILAVLLGSVVATLNGLSSAELGVDDPRAGGAYQFGKQLVSPIVGFVAGWLFVLAALAASATYALTFAAYLQLLLPGVPSRAVGIALVLAALALNVVGVRPSARANLVLVTINLAILVVFVALALPSLQVSRFQPFLLGGVGGLLQAGALLFFAYTGYARPVTIAEEVRDPRATLPRAVTTALGLTTLLYLGVAIAAVGVVGPERLGATGTPLAEVMFAAGRPGGALLLSLGAIVATTTVLLTEIWGLSRLVFAMARGGDIPGWLGRLTEPRRIPRNAVVAIGCLLLVLTAVVDLRPALEASSLALLTYYGVMNLSALRLPPGRRLYPPLVPAAGLAANALVATSLPLRTTLTVVAVAIVGMGYYLLRRRGRETHAG